MRTHETEPPAAEAALDVIPHPILVVAPDYRLVAANRAAREFAGRAAFADRPLTCYQWSHGRTRPCSGRRHPCPLREVLRTGRPVRVTHRHVRAGQAAAVVEIHAAPLLRADGTVRAVVESIHDITQQVLREQALDRRLNLEQALRRIDAALIGEKPVQEVLEAVLDAAVALGFPMCWVGLKETDRQFRVAGIRGFEGDDAQRACCSREDTPQQPSPTGRALRTGASVVCQDVRRHPACSPWRKQTGSARYRSLAAVPLSTGGEVLGLLTVYGARPGAFDADAVAMLEALARKGALALVGARRREELRRLQELYTFHIQRMPLAHILWDRDFRVVHWNPSAERIFGWTAAEVTGRFGLEFLVAPESRAEVESAWAALAAGAQPDHSVRVNLRRDGTRIVCEWFDTPLRDLSGVVVGVASMAQDLSEVDALRARALENERLFRELAEAAAEAILITDAAGALLYSNPAARRLLGEPSHKPQEQAALQLLRAIPRRAGSWEGEVVRHDGARLHLEGLVCRLETRVGTRYTYFLRDLSERKRYEEQLAYLADHDPLTGLFNRRRFQQELERCLARAREFGETGALVLLDLDRFKEVNDTLGHRAGDAVLSQLAPSLRLPLRETDVLARLGGDEFAVLLPGTAPARAKAIARELLESLRRHTLVLQGETVPLTASVGLAAFPADGDSADVLLARADLALYAAKDAGGNRVVLTSDLPLEGAPATGAPSGGCGRWRPGAGPCGLRVGCDLPPPAALHGADDPGAPQHQHGNSQQAG